MAKINSIDNKSSELTIDPGASGDSFVQFAINTTGEFRIGVDDDASDSFKISQGSALGSNDTFIMSASGERTMPLQPAFLARPASNETNITGDGTVATLIFGTEIFDQNSDFDGTSTFTAPVSGRYLFQTAVFLEDLTSSHTAYELYFSCTGRDYRLKTTNFAASQFVNSNQFNANGEAVIDMTAGDTCVVKIMVSGSSKVVDTSAGVMHFSGHLIC